MRRPLRQPKPINRTATVVVVKPADAGEAEPEMSGVVAAVPRPKAPMDAASVSAMAVEATAVAAVPRRVAPRTNAA